ncbi:uncharacterized protein LOC119576927 [Penaeus monodon]|uniref:uncharacterized protein LOC119576927 n=1 Tax=Penaeus monodon TaxID=6687 RepID=UPI0018A73064|nr:uncharacterized protein LOC119576927 [Penaeus monodon]
MADSAHRPTLHPTGDMFLTLFRDGPKVLSLFIGCLLGTASLLPISQAAQEGEVAGVVLREVSRKHRAFTVFAYTKDNCTSYNGTMRKLAVIRACERQILGHELIFLCKESKYCPWVEDKYTAYFNVTVEGKSAVIKFPATEDVALVPEDIWIFNNWTQKGNTSELVVKRNEDMVYKLRLSPVESPQEHQEVDGVLFENSSLIFQAQWDNLEYKIYYVYVVLFNLCDSEIKEFEAPRLHYVPEVTQPQKDSPARSWVKPVLTASTLLAAAGVVGLACRGHQPSVGALTSAPPGHRRGAAASEPPPRADPTRAPPAAAAPSKAVLLVYASDVIPQAKKLLEELREKTACKILDLHDVYDFDKLHDSAAWLLRALRNPAVLKILLVSEDDERLQNLHRSSVRIPVQDGDQVLQGSSSGVEGGRGLDGGSSSLRQDLEEVLSPLALPESRNKDSETCPHPGEKGCILPGSSTANESESGGERPLGEEGKEAALGFLYDYMIHIQESSCLFKDNLVYKAQFADGPLDRVTESRLFLLPRQSHFLVQAINAFVAGE